MSDEELQTQDLRSALEALQFEITLDAEFAGIFATLQAEYEEARQKPGFIKANWSGILIREQVGEWGELVLRKENLSADEQKRYDMYNAIMERSRVPHNNFYHVFTPGTYIKDLHVDHEDVMMKFDESEVGKRMQRALGLCRLERVCVDAMMPFYKGGQRDVAERIFESYQQVVMTATVNRVLSSAVTAAYDYLQEAGVDVENYTGRS